MANLLIEFSSLGLHRKVGYAGNSQSMQAPIGQYSITANWVTTSFKQFSTCSERSTQLNSTSSENVQNFATAKNSDFQFFLS